MTCRFPWLITVGVLLITASGAHGTDLAFAENFLAGSKQIVSFPVSNPSSMTVIGPQTDTFVGMDFDPNARLLWAVNFTTQSIGNVNQNDGVYTPTATLQAGCCNAFTIDPLRRGFYVAEGNHIYDINPASGETILLSQIDTGQEITALAIDCAGRKLALASNGLGDPSLYEWSQGSVLIGHPAYYDPTTLEFDNQNGSLYAWFNQSTGNTASYHVTVDPATAQESQPSLVAGKYRMAIRNTCPEHIFSDSFEG